MSQKAANKSVKQRFWNHPPAVVELVFDGRECIRRVSGEADAHEEVVAQQFFELFAESHAVRMAERSQKSTVALDLVGGDVMAPSGALIPGVARMRR